MYQLNTKEKSGISNSSEDLHNVFHGKKKTKGKIKIYYPLLKIFFF